MIHDFEVVPEPRQEPAAPAAGAQAPHTPAQIAREVEATLRKLLARQARLKAT
jgi:hypothetical protein